MKLSSANQVGKILIRGKGIGYLSGYFGLVLEALWATWGVLGLGFIKKQWRLGVI